MVRCACCQPNSVNDLDNTFGARRAAADSRRYLKMGLDRRGRKLAAYLITACARPYSVLDIGCGAGAVHLELLRRGVANSAVGVDASSAYVKAAAQNASVLGLGDAVSYRKADFAEEAASFAPADVVVMDRVICCYPHLPELLRQAAERAKMILALSFPVDNWWLRWSVQVVHVALKIMRNGYRPYLHPGRDVVAIASLAGLSKAYATRSGLWQIMVFKRG